VPGRARREGRRAAAMEWPGDVRLVPLRLIYLVAAIIYFGVATCHGRPAYGS
jgi:hypothetical protein